MTVCGVMMLWSLTQLKGWIVFKRFVWNDILSVFKGIKLNVRHRDYKRKTLKSIDIQKSIFVMRHGCFTFFCYICLSICLTLVITVSPTWHLCPAFRVNQSSHLLTHLCSLSRLSSSSLTRLSHQDLSLATNFQLYPSIDSTAYTLCFFLFFLLTLSLGIHCSLNFSSSSHFHLCISMCHPLSTPPSSFVSALASLPSLCLSRSLSFPIYIALHGFVLGFNLICLRSWPYRLGAHCVF